MPDLDNPQPDESISNRVPHVHHYVLKGSGGSHYAECDVVISIWNRADNGRSVVSGICREKLAGDNGPIVGRRVKVENAIKEAT